MMSSNYGTVLPLSCTFFRFQSTTTTITSRTLATSLSPIITWCDEKSRHYTTHSPWEHFPIIVVLPYNEVICQLLVAPHTGSRWMVVIFIIYHINPFWPLSAIIEKSLSAIVSKIIASNIEFGHISWTFCHRALFTQRLKWTMLSNVLFRHWFGSFFHSCRHWTVSWYWNHTYSFAFCSRGPDKIYCFLGSEIACQYEIIVLHHEQRATKSNQYSKSVWHIGYNKEDWSRTKAIGQSQSWVNCRGKSNVLPYLHMIDDVKLKFVKLIVFIL